MKRLALLFIAFISLLSCSDDNATSTYSRREHVYCYFAVLQYTELFHVMGNYGQFASIRKHVVNGATKITMTSLNSSTDYTADALSVGFAFGLGGLIVGTNNFGEARCYDLSCPICDRADRRLSLSDNGYAKCGKCGTTYDMNNDGAIYKIAEGASLTNPRGLYRYRIRYDGQIVNAYN